MIATGPYYLPIEGGEKITGMGQELSAPNLTMVEPWLQEMHFFLPESGPPNFLVCQIAATFEGSGLWNFHYSLSISMNMLSDKAMVVSYGESQSSKEVKQC